MIIKDEIHLGYLEPYAYRYSYKEAADIIIDRFFHDNSRDEFLIIPATYLYRHFVELSLKDIFFASNEMLDFVSEDSLENSNLLGHNLLDLANKVDEKIKKLSKKFDEDIEFFSLPEDLCNFKPLIKLLDKHDKGGQSFRYHKLNTGEKSLHSTTIVNIIELRSMVQHFDDNASGLIFYLEDCLSNSLGD